MRWVLSARPGAQAWGRRAELGGLGSPNRSAPDRAADGPLTRSSAPEAVPQLGGGRASLPLGIRTPSSPPPRPGTIRGAATLNPGPCAFRVERTFLVFPSVSPGIVLGLPAPRGGEFQRLDNPCTTGIQAWGQCSSLKMEKSRSGGPIMCPMTSSLNANRALKP